MNTSTEIVQTSKAERMKAIHGVPIKRECGAIVAKWSMSKHKDSKTHIGLMTKEEIPRKEREKQSEEERKAKQSKYNKERRLDNLEDMRDLGRQYYTENKTTLNEQVKCECGRMSSKRQLKRHREGKLHKIAMERQANK